MRCHARPTIFLSRLIRSAKQMTEIRAWRVFRTAMVGWQETSHPLTNEGDPD